MEKTILSAADAFKMLAGTKVFVESPEKANIIKEKLAKCGFEMLYSARLRSLPFIYIGEKYASAGSDFDDFWRDEGHKIMRADDIVNIDIAG